MRPRIHLPGRGETDAERLHREQLEQVMAQAKQQTVQVVPTIDVTEDRRVTAPEGLICKFLMRPYFEGEVKNGMLPVYARAFAELKHPAGYTFSVMGAAEFRPFVQNKFPIPWGGSGKKLHFPCRLEISLLRLEAQRLLEIEFVKITSWMKCTASDQERFEEFVRGAPEPLTGADGLPPPDAIAALQDAYVSLRDEESSSHGASTGEPEPVPAGSSETSSS